MANNPFDQRIINQLERPTSSDLNIAQGQINANVRAFARQLLQSTQSAYASGVGPGGALGNSFIIRAASSPSLTSVTMTRGVGFASYADVANNIGGITGLNTNLDYPVIYSQDRVLDLSGVAAPAADTCRRDVIALRAIGQSDNGLTDQGETDRYEPSLEAFQSVSLFKTLTASLTDQNLQVIESTDTPTGALVYIKGAAVPYADQDSLLNAPITTAGSGAGPYNNIAIINRYDGQSVISESDIVDYRLIASPGGQLTITGSATVGASGATPGAALSNVVLKAPPGIKASIYKLGANSATETNTYALIVAGPRGISSANMTCTLGLPGGSVTDTLFPSQVVFGTQSLSLSADDATATLLADAANSSPVQTVAVGQPYHVFPFTVGTVENVLVSATVPVTVSGGSITIPEPGESYPADTYAITNHSNYLTFYLNAEQEPGLPTSALPDPTYRLSTTLEALPETVISWEATGLTTSYIRAVGFVADAQVLKWEKGVWRLSVAAVGLPTTPPIEAVSPILAQVQVYTYNGSSNPESGSLVADSNEVLLSNRLLNVPEYADFFIDDFEPGSLSSSRLYIVIRLKKTRADLNGYASLYFNSAGDKLAIMQTNILADPPVLELKTPPPETVWPADTYSVTGASGSANLGLIPTGQPIFKPTATRFGTSGFTDLRTIPINFTVTLNRS